MAETESGIIWELILMDDVPCDVPSLVEKKRIIKFIDRYPVILSENGWGVQSPL